LMKPRTIRAADLFCGAGGTSTGLKQACAKLGYALELFAVNHWDIAIATHSANHPDAQHMCASIDAVDPRKAVPSGRLDLLWASPECTHHSIARGGRPVSDQGRASAWLILRWAELLYIDTILIENVKEFRDWCPVGANGRPLKSKRGETYRAFITALKSLGYRVEWRVLNAADYGAATTRERLFIQARRGRKPISWPNPSHSKSGASTLFGPRKKWRAAREVIDWTIPSRSIFARKRPLSAATMARIIAGLEKFGGKSLEPFLVILRNHGTAQSLDAPVPTLTAGGNHVGLAEPFILPHRMFDGMQVDSIDRPLRTIRATPHNSTALIEPFLIPFNGEHRGQSPRHHSLDEPLPTVTTNNRLGVAIPQPFLVQLTHGGRVHDADEPVPTITTAHRGETGLVEPYLLKYCSTGGARSVEEPMDTLTTKPRYGLVTPLVAEIDGQLVGLDIHFRMLTPRELARAMEFPDTYTFTGNREDVVKQIGNAVVTKQAEALCEAVLA
jgi:DNA (cytosine-5)-methyltransferase 1